MDAVSIVAAITAMLLVRVGGSAAFLALARRGYEQPAKGVLFATLLRVGLGVVGTTGIALTALAIGWAAGSETWWALTPLAVGVQATFRFVAWLTTLVIAYDPKRTTVGHDLALAMAGMLVSFLLDVAVAMLAVADALFLLRDFRMC